MRVLTGLITSSGGTGVVCLTKGLGVRLVCRHRPYRRHIGTPRPFCRGSGEGDGVSRSLGSGAGVAHLSLVLSREGGGVLRSLGKGAGAAHTSLLLELSRGIREGDGVAQQSVALLRGSSEGVSWSLGVWAGVSHSSLVLLPGVETGLMGGVGVRVWCLHLPYRCHIGRLPRFACGLGD